MQPFTSLTSKLVPLMAANIDTDQIIPARLVNVVGQDALRAALFANHRKADRDFVLNQPAMRKRTVILAGPNFGCGSSREAAVWALAAWGIRAVIGTSFNETFASNCLQNGVLALPVHPDIHGCLRANTETIVSIDLPGRMLLAPEIGLDASFDFDAFASHLLIEGRDELDYLLSRRGLIADFEQRRSL